MNARVLTLPQAPRSARSLIASSGMTDEQIADLSGGFLRANLVRMWREGTMPDPAPNILEVLADLTRSLPAAHAAARVS